MSGRPKGKNYFSVSISLTHEQTEWLNTQPKTTSETVRSLIDAKMRSETETEQTPESIRAKRVTTLNNELTTTTNRRTMLLVENKRHFKGEEHRNLRGTNDDGTPRYYDPCYVIENEDAPTPTDKTGEIIKTQLDALDAKIRQLKTDMEHALHYTEIVQLPDEYNRYEE